MTDYTLSPHSSSKVYPSWTWEYRNNPFSTIGKLRVTSGLHLSSEGFVSARTTASPTIVGRTGSRWYDEGPCNRKGIPLW